MKRVDLNDLRELCSTTARQRASWPELGNKGSLGLQDGEPHTRRSGQHQHRLPGRMMMIPGCAGLGEHEKKKIEISIPARPEKIPLLCNYNYDYILLLAHSEREKRAGVQAGQRVLSIV
jgi:hypothetical protein